VATVRHLKQWVIKTERTQVFQESLTTSNPALVHSVLLAHSAIYNLLNSAVYWCSQHYTHSILHFATLGAFPQSAVNTRCPLHATLWYPHSLSATRNTLISTLTVRYTQHSTVNTRCPLYAANCHAVRHTTVHLLLFAGLTLYNAYCTSRTYFALPVSAGYS